MFHDNMSKTNSVHWDNTFSNTQAGCLLSEICCSTFRKAIARKNQDYEIPFSMCPRPVALIRNKIENVRRLSIAGNFTSAAVFTRALHKHGEIRWKPVGRQQWFELRQATPVKRHQKQLAAYMALITQWPHWLHSVLSLVYLACLTFFLWPS